jgi:hypothetical protein
MAKGVPYFLKDGKEYKGQMHKMPDGSLHTGKTHNSKSVALFHLKDLPKKVAKKKPGKANAGTKKATKRK